ncbi:LacI family DNA-binding transcriptional regulator [Cohnella terricola]|uniref:LacI family transcriptional regulator n=1 Tax=Cohnella terricola TaxID=1289167 RepID=A0A559J9B9_9BACL|nr:LacI family DNA-binding transcriptional regulator [Cohnella terricola]TVX96461.1 LacI family transcriptional regulator [Cohnella terricola]
MAKIDDVARAAGVSKGTVSNVFSQKRPTSKQVTEKVLRASRELNYVPNHIARSLVTKKTMAIGLTIPHGNFFFSAFHTQFINGVVLEASTFGYRVLLDMIADREIDTPSLASYPIDGAIVLGPTEEDERIDMLHQNKIPFVTVGKILNSQVTDPLTVNNDNEVIMRDIVGYLTGLGHRHMTFLNAAEQTTVATVRTKAFEKVLGEKDIPFDSCSVHYKPPIHSEHYLDYGYEETVRALGGSTKPTAIIADDDRTAYCAMNAIKDAGLRVPEDVSLFVVCGDLELMYRTSPALTSMDLVPSELGSQAVKLLLHRLGIVEGEYEREWIVSSRINIRESCSPVRTSGNGD